MTVRHDIVLGQDSNGHSRSREELEERKDVVLGELLRRLDVLDRRRHRLQDAGGLVKYEVKRHLPLYLAIGAGTLALGGVVIRAVQARREREFRRQVLRRIFARLAGEDVVEPRRPDGVLGYTLRQTGLRLLLLAGTEIGRTALAAARERQRRA